MPLPTDPLSVISPKGRLFSFLHGVPHTTKDGREIMLFAWVSECIACGSPFEVRTTLRSPDPTHKRFSLVSCEKHRMSPHESLAIARRAQKEKRRKARELEAPHVLKALKGRPFGSIQQRLLDTLALTGETTLRDLVDTLVASLPAPTTGERDRRAEKVLQATRILRDRGLVLVEGGAKFILPLQHRVSVPCAPSEFTTPPCTSPAS